MTTTKHPQIRPDHVRDGADPQPPRPELLTQPVPPVRRRHLFPEPNPLFHKNVKSVFDITCSFHLKHAS